MDLDKIAIGRGSPCDIRLPLRAVSYHHATVERLAGGGHVVTDRGSRNGTSLNGARLHPHKKHPLRSGDAVEICGFVLEVTLSVPITDAYTAEKTDLLERGLAARLGAGGGAYSLRVEVSRGPGDEPARHDLPAEATAFRLGNAAGCDVPVDDKSVRPCALEAVRTPAGWQLGPARGEQLPQGVALPPRGRVRDGDELRFGKTLVVFRDPVDEELAALRTDREEEPLPAAMAPEGGPPGVPRMPGKRAAEKAAADGDHRAAPQAGQTAHGYSYEYRLAAIGFGILAFLVSILLLIVLVF